MAIVAGAGAWAFSYAARQRQDCRCRRRALALIAANVFVLFFALSWGVVVWVLLGEMFPNRIRAAALGVAASAQWIAHEPGADQRPRFSMLETVREYALERQEEAGETATIKRRHLEWSVPMMRDGAGLASCWRIPPRRRPRVLGRMLWGQMVSSRTARATTRRRSIGLTRPTSWRSSSATSSRARWPSVFKEMCASARGAGTGNHALRT